MYGVKPYSILKDAPFLMPSAVEAEIDAFLVVRWPVWSLRSHLVVPSTSSLPSGQPAVNPSESDAPCFAVCDELTVLPWDWLPAQVVVSVAEERSVTIPSGVLRVSGRSVPAKSCFSDVGYERRFPFSQTGWYQGRVSAEASVVRLGPFVVNVIVAGYLTPHVSDPSRHTSLPTI